MSKFCRVFFFVFIAICSWVRAETQDLDKYQITVSNIHQELHCISLSNGMICHVVEKEWGKEKSLVVWDKVIFTPAVWHVERKGALQEEGNFRLSFSKEQKKATLFAWASEESKPVVVNYVADSSVCIKPAGWFSSKELAQVLELSDGSKWEVMRKCPSYVISKFAKEGDRILIAPLNFPDHGVILVNIDRMFYEVDSGKETVGMYRTIGVFPYQDKNSE